MNYKRKLSDLTNIQKNGYTVFSCFSCGGGSTMGYKNAGYDVIGTCEIDAKMDKIYRSNFGDTYNYVMGVQDFKNIPNNELPQELFNLHILDGSPPCSTFSTSGSREKSRGKDKVFREGQAKQVLSDLFFDFLDVAYKLGPKVIIAENVSGMLKGNAKGYVKMIFKRLDEIGYTTQLFLLDGSTMGLPQRRQRVFFIAHKKELILPKITLYFDEKKINFGDIKQKGIIERPLKGKALQIYKHCKYGDRNFQNACFIHEGKNNFFNHTLLYDNEVCGTITAKETGVVRGEARYRNKEELMLCGSYPLDYDFGNQDPGYLIGMSVPPLMMYKIAKEVKEQRLDKLKK